MISVAGIGGDDGEVFAFAEPIMHGAGTAGRGDIELGEEKDHGARAVHALGEGGGTGFVGDLRVSGEGFEAELEHGFGAWRKISGPGKGDGGGNAGGGLAGDGEKWEQHDAEPRGDCHAGSVELVGDYTMGNFFRYSSFVLSTFDHFPRCNRN